jgi:hypothetical protein
MNHRKPDGNRRLFASPAHFIGPRISLGDDDRDLTLGEMPAPECDNPSLTIPARRQKH